MELDPESKSFKISPQLIINALLIGFIIVLSLFYFREYINIKDKTTGQDLNKKVGEVDISSNIKKITVDIEGAIHNPGIYEIAENKRIYDVISLAGGFTENVNVEEVSMNLNKAEKLKDGMKIFIPFNGQKVADTNNLTDSNTPENKIININTADKEQLEKLPKVGAVTADKIIQNRPYENINDLITKKVLGQSTFDGLKDLIDV